MAKVKTLFITLLLLLAITDLTLSKKKRKRKSKKKKDKILDLDKEYEEYSKNAPPPPDYLKKEVFLERYASNDPKESIIKAGKRFFPTQETTLDKKQYSNLLNLYAHGAIYDAPIDKELPDDRQFPHIKEEIADYLAKEKKDKEAFDIHDFFVDVIQSEFYKWLDKKHSLGYDFDDEQDFDGDI